MSGSQNSEAFTADYLSDPIGEEPFSLFELVSVLVRYRRQILIAMVVGGTVAAIPVLFKQYAYKATASFAPQNSDAGKAGISALAGAFGISVPSGNLSQSPQFYAELLTSRAILVPILSDTFAVPELKGVRLTIPELFEINGLAADRTSELAVTTLTSAIRPEVNKSTGIVTVSVTTPWRSVSLALVQALLKQVNSFNLQTRQSQASDERRFIEGRLTVVQSSLQVSEGRLESFLRTNRQIMNSPELVLARDRLQRDVDLNQQVVTSLSQSLEDARIREVRDIPVIAVIEPPLAQTTPESRGRLRRGLLGVTLGGIIAIAFALIWDLLSRRLAAGDPEIEKYKKLLGGLGRGLSRFRAKPGSRA